MLLCANDKVKNVQVTSIRCRIDCTSVRLNYIFSVIWNILLQECGIHIVGNIICQVYIPVVAGESKRHFFDRKRGIFLFPSPIISLY